MAFTTQSNVTVGNCTKASDMNTAIDNTVFLNTQLTSTGGSQTGLCPTVPNYSFETDSDANNIPDSWTFTPYSSGSGALDTTTSGDGTYSFKIVIPGGGGNGGGYLENNDFLPCSNIQDYYLQWKYKTSVATTTNQVELRFFDKDQNFISATVIQSASSGQSTSWALNWGKVLAANVPATAKFLKIRLTGGSVGSAAGNTWYDAVQFFKPCIYGIADRYDTPGTFTWTSPENCISVTVEMVAGGGGGSSSAGGGGGGYNKIYYSINPGTAYTLVVGGGGNGGATLGAAGSTGGQSKFNGTGPAGGAGSNGTLVGAGGAAVGISSGTPFVLAAINGAAGSGANGGSAGNGYFEKLIPFASNRGLGGADSGSSGAPGVQGSAVLYY